MDDVWDLDQSDVSKQVMYMFNEAVERTGRPRICLLPNLFRISRYLMIKQVLCGEAASILSFGSIIFSLPSFLFLFF